MQKFQPSDWAHWERIYRANFINSLSGIKPAVLIGTCNRERQTNLALFSNVVHLGADPALIGLINRPREATPHTLSNIEASGFFTINHIHPEMLAQAHQTSAKYPADESEFEATGLTAQWEPAVSAPYVKESRLKCGLSVKEIIPLSINRTFLVIGQIEQVLLEDDKIVQPDGFLDLQQLNILASSGLDAYYQVQQLGRLGYARPPKANNS